MDETTKYILYGIAFLFAVGFYFIPSIIGFSRKHTNSVGIFIVNLFFGWSLIGWIVCFIWALSSKGQSQTVNVITQTLPSTRQESGSQLTGLPNISAEKNYCSKCGGKLMPSAQFCHKCGFKQYV